MDSIIVIITVLAVCFVLYLIYSIYEVNKEQEERLNRMKAYDENQKNLMEEERKKESVKWNKKIQSQYNDKLVKFKYESNMKIKVLVGDYTTSMAPYTNSILKSMGIQTEVVPTASDVIDRINSGKKYDFIITNNVYPKGESGKQVLDTLKAKEGFSTPIIILTIDQDARELYVDELGFDEYIPKPLDVDKVKRVFTKLKKDLKFVKIKKQ